MKKVAKFWKIEIFNTKILDYYITANLPKKKDSKNGGGALRKPKRVVDRGRGGESRFGSCLMVALIVTVCCVDGRSQDTFSTLELKKKSLEELMDIEVSLVSKRPEKLTEAASAVQVLDGDMIRRAGPWLLPEALRLAPNLQVARVSSRDWAVTARGFNNTLANKLLVMMDGRTIYTPLYAGVFWDVNQCLMEDVDRIEIISGPGGTMWGANAVNGVINIISREAKETQGLYASVGAGSMERDYGGVRYGGKAGENAYYRVYGRRLDLNSTDSANGGRDMDNSWDLTQGGFRMDWLESETDRLTAQGDMYAGALQQTLPGETSVNGQNLLGRWVHTFTPESETQLQVYFDRTSRDIPATFGEDLKTYDIDFQHRFPIGSRQNTSWGAGYRFMHDDVENSPLLAFLPASKNMQRINAFLQDEIVLVPERARLTLGSKLEHNGLSGFEFQPAGRLAWTPGERHALWTAVSRAVRTPSRIDVEFFARIPRVAPLDTLKIEGGPDFTSEKVIAYEFGYRVRPIASLSLSVATFYNRYDDLRSSEFKDATTIEIRNGLQGDSRGAELSGSLNATAWWVLRGGYTYLESDTWEKPGHVDPNGGAGEGSDPSHQFLIQTMMDLPADFQVNATARYVGVLPVVGPIPDVPDYFTFDMGLVWRFHEFELSVLGNNLAAERHLEFGRTNRQDIPRSVTGRLTWRK